MNQYLNEQIETELLCALMSNPGRFYDFPLKSKYFSHPRNMAVMELIESKMYQNGTVGLVDLMELKGKITISEFFPKAELMHLDLLPNYLTAAKELVESYVKREIKKLLGHDPTIEQTKETVEELLGESAGNDVVSAEQVTSLYDEHYKKLQLQKTEGRGIGILTYWPIFNRIGLRHTDLFVIGARPSIGKTSFGVNLAMQIAGAGQKVLFFSCEMGMAAVIDKFVALASGENVSNFRFGNMANVTQYTKQFAGFKDNISFVFNTKTTSTDLFSKAAGVKDIDVIIVDYLQLLSDEIRKGETENNRITRISHNLKMLAMQKNCCVIALAQLNRGSEKDGREPILSDLRDSGAIEQDADVVGLLHRKDRASEETTLIVAKNRNGETGRFYFFFDQKAGKFIEQQNEFTQ